jgi:hypothetical protein
VQPPSPKGVPEWEFPPDIALSHSSLGTRSLPIAGGGEHDCKNYRRDGIGGIGYLLITIFIHPVTMFLMANEVEQLYRNEGKEPKITTLWGLWFLLPLIGNIIWYFKIQGALNEFWQEHGATSSPGLT